MKKLMKTTTFLITLSLLLVGNVMFTPKVEAGGNWIPCFTYIGPPEIYCMITCYCYGDDWDETGICEFDCYLDEEWNGTCACPFIE